MSRRSGGNRLRRVNDSIRTGRLLPRAVEAVVQDRGLSRPPAVAGWWPDTEETGLTSPPPKWNWLTSIGHQALPVASHDDGELF